MLRPRILSIALPLVLTACASDPDTLQAGIDVAALDQAADPCEDFYQYACGGYLANNPVPDGGGFIARRSAAFFAAQEVERAILQAAPEPGPDGAALAAYHGACRAAGPGEQPITALTAALGTIDAAAGPAGIAKAVAAVHAVGGAPLFSFGSARNLANPGKRMAAVGDAGLGMPDRVYYLDPQDEIAAYRDHIGALSNLVGIDDPGLPDAVIGIETQLAAAMLPEEDTRDPEKTFHPTDRAAFEASVPDFDWAAYREAVAAPPYDTIDVVVPASFEAMESILKNTPLADLQRYLRWTAIEALAGAMGDPVVAEEAAFHRGVFIGSPDPLPRAEYCIRATNAALPWPMSRAYVARAYSPATDAAAEALAVAIRGAMEIHLQTVGWLDGPTRKAALDKLGAMHIEVGAPDAWPTVEGLVLDDHSYVDAHAAVKAFSFAKGVAAIGTDDGGRWFMAPSTVNAAYSPARNTVNLAAGILQEPYFSADHHHVVQLGAMGSIVGHELTHGFDDSGRLFGPTGALSDFWSSSTDAAFHERAACLVEQYDAIEALPGEYVNGELTLGENIADLGGVKVAYAAAAPSADEGGVLTDAQAFFVAYAQTRCSNIRPEYQQTLLATDPHSPDRARANAVLANVPAFADAFSCQPGSKMAPAKRCDVW